jgi:hypothetical protein
MFPERCLEATSGDPIGALLLAVDVTRRQQIEAGTWREDNLDELEHALTYFEHLERELLERRIIRYA